LRKATRVVRGGAPHPWRTEGEGLDEVARRALGVRQRAAGPLSWTAASAVQEWTKGRRRRA
jgi:hypothetical protein